MAAAHHERARRPLALAGPTLDEIRPRRSPSHADRGPLVRIRRATHSSGGASIIVDAAPIRSSSSARRVSSQRSASPRAVATYTL